MAAEVDNPPGVDLDMDMFVPDLEDKGEVESKERGARCVVALEYDDFSGVEVNKDNWVLGLKEVVEGEEC